MSKPSDILTAIQTILKNSTDLSYVNNDNIFLGVRESISMFPSIVLEVTKDRVVQQVYPYEKIIMSVLVAGFINVFEKDLQLVGNTTVKGVLDFKNDVKKALSSDHTLAGYAIDSNMVDSIDRFEEYPIRSFHINFEVYYEQDRILRT